MTTMGRPVQRVRAFDQHHPLWWDLAVPIASGPVMLNASPPLQPLGVALLLLVLAGVALRRRAPVPALLVVLAGVVVGAAVSGLTDHAVAWVYPAVWVALFNVGLRHGARHTWAVGAMIAVVGLAAFITPVDGMTAVPGERVRMALSVSAMSAATYLAGLQIDNRRQALVAHRRDAAREAVIAERSRIAHEMHDIIGHNLSVITSLATGGAVAVHSSPQDAVSALDAIGEISRSSVREVRRVLAVLRYDQSPDGAPLSPQPGLDDVAGLVDTVRAAGIRVALERSGDLGGVPAGRQLVVYRIVQESLTNVLRHAGAQTQVIVTIAREGTDLVVLVDDDGAGATSSRRVGTAEPGHGILGMRERAEAYGGTVDAHATPHGWQVHARIPDDQHHAR